jgi:hypothetical protein
MVLENKDLSKKKMAQSTMGQQLEQLFDSIE